MREWVYDRLGSTVGVISHVPIGRIFSASAVGLDKTSPDRPFIIVRGSGEEIHRPSIQQTYSIYVHDSQGSYLTHIDPVLWAIKEAFDLVGGVRHGASWITLSEWLGNSGDLYDDMFQTATKYADVRVTYRR